MSNATTGSSNTWPSLPLRKWPEGDRQTWLANTERTKRHRRPKPADRFADDSLLKFEKGYRRWLGFLMLQGWLDPLQAPRERVTTERLDAYFEALQASGAADNTIVGRFRELASALSLLEPSQDWRWVQGPPGGVIPRHLHRRRALIVPHPRVLYRWGIGLMEKALAAGVSLPATLQFRDGLIIAMEAARARRLRSMAGLQVGSELVRLPSGCWHIDLPPNRVKTHLPDRFTLPASLTPYVDRYLGEYRPLLLRGRESTAMWIGNTGQDLSQKAYSEMYGLRARKRFKVRFGPHRNRHAAVTAGAIDAPHDPTLAARMLGISPNVAREAYNRAGQAGAAKGFNIMIDQLQAEAVTRMGYRKARTRLRAGDVGGDV